jgi:hypothetical protein
MSSHGLLLDLDATPSWEGATPFSGRNGLCPPNPGAPFLVSQDIWPRLPPDCTAVVPCISRNGYVHQGTSAAGDTYPPPLQSPLFCVVAESAHARVAQVQNVGKPRPLLHHASGIRTPGNP